MIISICLVILTVLTMFSFILGTTFIGSPIDVIIKNDLLINDTVTSLAFEDSSAIFVLDPVLGGISILTTIGVIGGILGVTILGSGLNPESVKLVMSMIMYGGMWGLLSILAFPLLVSIEIFGAFIYVTLTIGYVIGIVQKLGDAG